MENGFREGYHSLSARWHFHTTICRGLVTLIDVSLVEVIRWILKSLRDPKYHRHMHAILFPA